MVSRIQVLEMTDMNAFHFEGRLATDVPLTRNGKSSHARFRLIRTEYAGKDEQGDRRERQVAIPFVAFDSRAETIAQNCFKGDQLVVTARIQNDRYEKDGEERFDYSFVIEDFNFGAPGPKKRALLAKQGGGAHAQAEESDDIPS